MLIDLHVHFPLEDLTPEKIAEGLSGLPLDGVALLGENAFARLGEVREAHGVRFFSGAKVRTERGRYLVFIPECEALPPLDEVFGPRHDGVWKIRDVLARTHALGGAVIAAHPYDPTVEPKGGDIVFTLPHLTAIEAINPAHPPMVSAPAVDAADTLGLPCTGGSGARTLEGLGKAATLFSSTPTDEKTLVEALLSGECWPVEIGEPPATLQRGGAREPRDPFSERDGARESGGGRRRRRRR